LPGCKHATSIKEECDQKVGKCISLQSHQFAKMCQHFSENGAAIQMNGGRRGFKIEVLFTAFTATWCDETGGV
jgi:hypothetical protein